MAITSDDLQSIVSAVLSSIRTNSRTIDQLTPVTALADTDNLEVHGGKRVVFSILRNLILSKSGVDELKTELKPKLAELDDVVEIHSVRSDIGVILAQPSGPLTVYHGSTDEGYGVVYDSTRKRFYLVGTSTLPNPNTDVSGIQAYGDWSDEAVFGDSPESGSGRIPVRGKIYVCATDGGLYYWNGTDLVDLIKGILANTNALSILNRRGQVEPFAAVLTSDPDDDPIPEELNGKRVWSTQFNKFLEINIVGDPPYQTPEDSAAVVDKFYICDGRLYLGVKVSQTATTLKPLFDSEIKQLSRTHSITLTRVADLRYSWSGAALTDIRQGDILTWTDADEMFRAVVFGERTSGTRREVCAMFTRDGDQAIEFSLLWLYENGEAYETVFDSSQTLAWQFAACQNKLTDTADIQVRAEARPSGQNYTPYGLYLKDSAKRAVFVDMWNNRCKYGNDEHAFGGYLPDEAPDADHPFLLNKIWMTYADAVQTWMLSHNQLGRSSNEGLFGGYGVEAYEKYSKCKTYFPIYCGMSYGAPSLVRAFKGNRIVETLSFVNGYGVVLGINAELQGAFDGCWNLREILSEIRSPTAFDNYTFRECRSLTEIRISRLLYDVCFADSPLLSLASFQYLVTNAANTSAITVTVHADVFAKLTGDTTNEAAAALTDDEKAAWAAVLEAACAKNISFAAA